MAVIENFEDLVNYFLHSFDCTIHLIIPAIIVGALLFGLIVIRKRKTGTYSLRLQWIAVLGALFFLLWIVDIPAVFGRCPGVEPPPNFPAEDPFLFIDVAGLAFGLSAGLVTFLSPCGLPPLPAFISYFLGARATKERGSGLGVIATSGFILAIAAIGIVLLITRNFFINSFATFQGQLFFIEPIYLELLEFVAGILALLVGALMLVGKRLPFFQLGGARAPKKRSTRALFLFSIFWGSAAITCSPYVLFPVILYAVGRGGAEPFVGYALGMALPVFLISLLLGAGRGPIVNRLVKMLPKLTKLSGAILIVMGIYIVQYTFFSISPLFTFFSP